jgi:hypothetical protein
MTRAIKLDLDGTFEVFDLGAYPHLKEVIGAYFDVVWVNGPIASHPKQITVGIAVDDEGLLKQLKVNKLACSLYGIFVMAESPLVGTAVVIASDYEGETVDVPDWVVQLVSTIYNCTAEAFKYHQNWRMN